jgi:hypothetical protein
MQNQINQNQSATFETGATTAQANNLVLSVLNDGAVYERRKHSGFACLVGANSYFGEIVKSEVTKQRSLGSTFKPQHITEAIKLVKKDTIEHCLEIIRDEFNPENQLIIADCRRWWDKINGNSYFSVSIHIGKHSINIPYQYGYGNQWEFETVNLLEKIGVIDKSKYQFNSEIKFLIFRDGGYMNKNTMFQGEYI